ncbi:MAG: hypothetical protein ACOYJX_01740 [Acutalibacteraceae bacterium]|jgi:ribosomal protein L14E/L6E/L27E
MGFQIYSVVESAAGRDKGKLLAVMEIEAERITVCDGKERPLERPKRKNPAHLINTGRTLTPEQTKTNRALRKALAGFARSDGPKEEG